MREWNGTKRQRGKKGTSGNKGRTTVVENTGHAVSTTTVYCALSLLPSAGREMSTGQRALMLCGWGINTDMARYFTPGRGVKNCDEHVCLSVCSLSTHKKPHGRPHQFLCMLPTVLVWFSSGGVACVLPVLRMTLYFSNGSIARYVLTQSACAHSKYHLSHALC